MIYLKQLIEQQTSHRKLRLFAVACCQPILHLLKSEHSLEAIRLAELYADNLISEKKLYKAQNLAKNLSPIAYSSLRSINQDHALVDAAYAAASTTHRIAEEAALNAADGATSAIVYNSELDVSVEELILEGNKQCKPMIDDIFYQYKLIVPMNTTIIAIAEHIYETKQWSDMCVLADALEDQQSKGSQEIINHLRANQPHYRGCWALDLILNKE